VALLLSMNSDWDEGNDQEDGHKTRPYKKMAGFYRDNHVHCPCAVSYWIRVARNDRPRPKHFHVTQQKTDRMAFGVSEPSRHHEILKYFVKRDDITCCVVYVYVFVLTFR
jgi:hypothetical protein